MWKLIKMDSYRLFHGRTIKVGAIMAALLSFGYVLLSLGIIALTELMLKEDPDAATDMGVLLSQVAWMNGVNFSEIVIGATTALSLFVGCIISASFIGSEQSCGYTKNFAGQLTNKGNMVISKFVVTSIVQVIILVIYAIVGAIAAKLVLGKYINGYDIEHLFEVLGVRLVLHIAINSIIIFVCTLTKSHAVAMIAGCVFSLGVTKIAYPSISMLLSAIKIRFDVSEYMPDGINDQLGIDNVEALALKAIIVSVVFIAVFLTANYYVTRDRDVR